MRADDNILHRFACTIVEFIMKLGLWDIAHLPKHFPVCKKNKILYEQLGSRGTAALLLRPIMVRIPSKGISNMGTNTALPQTNATHTHNYSLICRQWVFDTYLIILLWKFVYISFREYGYSGWNNVIYYRTPFTWKTVLDRVECVCFAFLRIFWRVIKMHRKFRDWVLYRSSLLWMCGLRRWCQTIVFQ